MSKLVGSDAGDAEDSLNHMPKILPNWGMPAFQDSYWAAMK
jgi:hypothetical protein